MKSKERKRIIATVSCNDCKSIPKVKNAGKVFSGKKKYQLMHNGIKIVYGRYHGLWMAEIIRILKGHHEPQEEKVFYEVLKRVPNGGGHDRGW